MKVGKTAACFILALACLFQGCKADRTGEVEVPEVQIADLPEISQTEEQEEAALDPEAIPGTVLGEEEVILMGGEAFETVLYTRVRAAEGSSLAYDPEQFSAASEGNGLLLQALEDPDILLRVQTEEGISAEDLADSYAYESNQECTVEDVTIGEGEYPAIWVSYSEGTESTDLVFDLYVLRYNGILYVVKLQCTQGLFEELGEEQQVILSTLRFDEG